jgi:hypothetical protein
MRRRWIIATFVLLLASLPVAAQHGMGHAGGGHAGFSGGHMGGFSGHSGFSGGHVSGGMRSGQGVSRGFAHSPSFSQRGFPQRSFSNRPFLHDGFRHNRGRFFGFRNNCFGFGCGFYYPYAYSGFYDPYWWWDSGSSSSYDEDYERNRAEADQMNQQSLAEQRMRRQEEGDGDQDIYSQPSQPRPSSGSAMSNDRMSNDRMRNDPPTNDPQEAAVPATVLIFRDQHKLELRNYAIVGQTLWSFGSPRTQKIPLADLDLAATTKANDDRGLSFRVPSANEAQ